VLAQSEPSEERAVFSVGTVRVRKDRIAVGLAITLLITSLVLLFVGLAWPTAPYSCGNGPPPAPVPRGKVDSALAGAIAGGVGAVVALLFPIGPLQSRRLAGSIVVAGGILAFVGFILWIGVSYPACGGY
jgi:hypothetical protein